MQTDYINSTWLKIAQCNKYNGIFNVYGSAGHQIADRTYMDILRQDGEDNFLRFMPANQRQSIYNSWYIGSDSRRTVKDLFSIDRESQVQYKTNDYKKGIFDRVIQKLAKAAEPIDTLNRCYQPTCNTKNINEVRQHVENQLRKLTQIQGHKLGDLPEMSLLRVKTDDDKVLSSMKLYLARLFLRKNQYPLANSFAP